jgi:hypothetical protein
MLSSDAHLSTTSESELRIAQLRISKTQWSVGYQSLGSGSLSSRGCSLEPAGGDRTKMEHLASLLSSLWNNMIGERFSPRPRITLKLNFEAVLIMIMLKVLFREESYIHYAVFAR